MNTTRKTQAALAQLEKARGKIDDLLSAILDAYNSDPIPSFVLDEIDNLNSTLTNVNEAINTIHHNLPQ